jgi:hypothetical protein
LIVRGGVVLLCLMRISLLHDAWRFAQNQEARGDGVMGSVMPRNVDELLPQAMHIFHSMSDLASRITVRPLFVRDSEHEIQQPTMIPVSCVWIGVIATGFSDCDLCGMGGSSPPARTCAP